MSFALMARWRNCELKRMYRAVSFGRPTMIAIGLAVLSHLPLDAIIHPRPLELWPHAALALGHPAWAWGQIPFALKKTRYWWIQLAIVLPLLAFYWGKDSDRKSGRNLVVASCLVVLGGLAQQGRMVHRVGLRS